MKLMMLVEKHGDIEDISMEGKYKEAFEHVHEVLENPPSTWKKYEYDPEGCDAIINMEAGELNTAKKKKEFWGSSVEYTHLAAAVIHDLSKILEHEGK